MQSWEIDGKMKKVEISNCLLLACAKLLIELVTTIKIRTQSDSENAFHQNLFHVCKLLLSYKLELLLVTN